MSVTRKTLNVEQVEQQGLFAGGWTDTRRLLDTLCVADSADSWTRVPCLSPLNSFISDLLISDI